MFFHFFQKNLSKSTTKETIIKMFYNPPRRNIAGTTFGNKGMDMWIPLEVTAKGMQHTEKARCELFGFIYFRKHVKDNIPDRMKKATKKRTILEKKDT